MIEEFLDTLTKENRVIFMSRYWFSDSNKEIAVRTGLTENNVAIRLNRICKLHANISPRGGWYREPLREERTAVEVL